MEYLKINGKFKEIFKNESITGFKRNKGMQEIIGTHWIENGRVRKDLKTLKKGKCIPIRSKARNMLQTSENYNNVEEPTNKTWKIFHITNCKTEYAIYLMECTIYNLQYVGKNETPFNISFSNHRKHLKDPKSILGEKHFQTMVIDLTNTKVS